MHSYFNFPYIKKIFLGVSLASRGRVGCNGPHPKLHVPVKERIGIIPLNLDEIEVLRLFPLIWMILLLALDWKLTHTSYVGRRPSQSCRDRMPHRAQGGSSFLLLYIIRTTCRSIFIRGEMVQPIQL